MEIWFLFYIFIIQYGYFIVCGLIVSLLSVYLMKIVTDSKNNGGLKIKHILAYSILLPLALPAILIRFSSSVFLKVLNKISLLIDKFLNIRIGK